MIKATLRIFVIVTSIAISRAAAADGGAQALQESSRINELASTLLQISLAEGELKNAVVSSVSLFYALSMLETGALEQSKTRLQTILLANPTEQDTVQDIAVSLASTLIREPGRGNSEEGFAMRNSLWATNGASDGKPFVFAPAFAENIAGAFDADVHNIDFLGGHAASRVNQWAEESTRGQIDEIIDRDTIAELTWLIINAAYFEGAWASPMLRLPAADDYRFITGAGEEQHVATVTSKQVLRVVDADDGSVVLSIPFSDGKYHMVLQIPAQDEQSIPQWLRGRAIPRQADAIEAVFSARSTYYDVKLRMPVFSFSDRISLMSHSPATAELGLELLFSDKAKLFAMVDMARSHPALHDTKVGLLQQDARIALDENGVKAAAVTVIGGLIKSTMAPGFPPRTVVLNRPFAWTIVERGSRTALFSGVLATPSDGE